MISIKQTTTARAVFPPPSLFSLSKKKIQLLHSTLSSKQECAIFFFASTYRKFNRDNESKMPTGSSVRSFSFRGLQKQQRMEIAGNNLGLSLKTPFEERGTQDTDFETRY